MATPSTQVNAAVRRLLQPFVDYRDDWILHYPVYLNTFCLTYDLAALLSGSPAPRSADALFRRHDWWTGLPQFTYRRDIEIFVAVDSMIQKARADGHDIQSRQIVRFTRYDVKKVFVRKRAKGAPRPRKWLLVTDVPQSSQELVSAWQRRRPAWLKQFGNFRLTSNDIRLSIDRELHDLFANDGKVYLFSAPMAYVLKQQSQPASRAKYIEQNAGMKPIDTYFVFRCNTDVDPAKIRLLRDATAAYYRLLLGATRPQHYLHPQVAREYGRIASTVGQPQPFPEIHDPRHAAAAVRSPANNAILVKRYADILLDHHSP